ncbi:MAG: M15 family metallopeptidase [Clostridia bacterium]|nr:M15 family metallopeptidase [Clostridia bacterium]
MKLKKILNNFKIDFNKPITFREQMIIMSVILAISCLLFTVVYFAAEIRNKNITTDTSEPSQLPESSVSVPESQYESSEPSNYNPVSNSESSKNESSENKSSEPSENSVKQEIKYVSKDYDEIYNGNLILVNKDYASHHDGENTVSLMDNKSSTYGITDNSVYVDSGIVKNMNNMFDDFADIYGYTDVMVACAYRSYAVQVRLYNEEVDKRGDDREAEQWVAPPGFSEHQSGYAFDLNLSIENGVGGIKYDGTGVYSWINQNCYKYGFILRYLQGKEKITGYEYEPWHFRYVGEAHAYYIMKNMITLEEYIDIVHTHSIDNPLVINGENGEVWHVHYIAAQDGTTKIPVLKNYSYEISGDNFSGFIVTQKVK